ncbi:hypothetical protein BDR26DRAFT_903869 [Obelidium mucronatum]|nr:hypothetical protein BDR26DRAFT_903869 [Obelidium mucronatum]
MSKVPPTAALPFPLPQELLREIDNWLDPLTLYLHKKLGPIAPDEYCTLIAAIKQLQTRFNEVRFDNIQAKESFSLSFEPLFIVSKEMEALLPTPQPGHPDHRIKDRLYLIEKNPTKMIHLVIETLEMFWMHKVSVWFTDQACRFILPYVLALDKLTSNHRILAVAARNGNFIMCEKLAQCFLELDLSEEAPDEELEEIDSEYGEDWRDDCGDAWGNYLKVSQILPDSYEQALKHNHNRVQRLIFNTALKTDAPILWGIQLPSTKPYIARSTHFFPGNRCETDVVHDLLENGEEEMVFWLMSRVENMNTLFRNIQTYSLAFGRFELFKSGKESWLWRRTDVICPWDSNQAIDVVRWILENTDLKLDGEIDEPDDWERADCHMEEVDVLVALLGDHFEMVRFLVLEMGMRFPEIQTSRQRDWNQRHVDLGLELGHAFDDKDKVARSDLFFDDGI